MSKYKGPLDYIDVATRIVEFRTQYPSGTLSAVSPSGVFIEPKFIDHGGKSWVVYTAFAYRSPDDVSPGVGMAWEPVPGPTSFTRDSELQNAETAAWGRAMVAALAVDTKKGIASQEEVRNRQRATAVPADWKQAIENAKTVEELTTFYNQGNSAGWMNQEILTALSARKEVLNGSHSEADS